MQLSPGDTIQIILTVGGVPFAKTGLFDSRFDFDNDAEALAFLAERMTIELAKDIDLYANETESANEEAVR